MLKTKHETNTGCCKRMCRSVHPVLCFSVSEEYKKTEAIV